jgi:hypothetical protein
MLKQTPGKAKKITFLPTKRKGFSLKEQADK